MVLRLPKVLQLGFYIKKCAFLCTFLYVFVNNYFPMKNRRSQKIYFWFNVSDVGNLSDYVRLFRLFLV